MRKVVVAVLVLVLLMSPAMTQERDQGAGTAGEVKKEKVRPPRIPDGPFVPKRGMVKREKGQFWAGPPDEGRFAQILGLTLVPKDKLHEKLAEWSSYQELSPEQQARLMERISQVREVARKLALEVAQEFDLQVGPGQEEEFVRLYWTERLGIEQALKEELFTKRKKLEEESERKIQKKFPKAVKN